MNRATLLHAPPVAGLEDGRGKKAGCHVDWRCERSFGYTFYETACYHSDVGQSYGDANFLMPAYYPTVREMGWPVRSLRSIAHFVGEGPDALRWRLPWSEILSRGLQTNDLPAVLHPSAEARLALVPMPLGFAVNTLLYAAVAWGMTRGLAYERRRRAGRSGFEVLLPPVK